MGAGLAAEVPAAAALFATAREVLGYDLLELCASGPAEKLNSTVFSQPALYVCSLAAVEKLRAQSPETIDACTITAGLSLGEYTALTFAGALDFVDGLRLVQVRGEAMQAASDLEPSGMVSILGLERSQVEQLCDAERQHEVLQVANLLCPGNIVVSGHLTACARVAAAAEAAGATKAIPLTVAGAFHTPLMEPAAQRLRAALAETEFRRPRIPVLSNVDAAPHDDPAEFPKLLAQQLTSPVLWEDSQRWLLGDYGASQCYELGPGRVLRGLLKRLNRKFPCDGIEA
jgi:[acyl-carrier-protein] S-malonyltransferase